MIFLVFRDLAHGLSDRSCGGWEQLVSTPRHSVSVPRTDFGMKYYETLPGNAPAVFLYRFPGRTRPQRPLSAPVAKNDIFFTL